MKQVKDEALLRWLSLYCYVGKSWMPLAVCNTAIETEGMSASYKSCKSVLGLLNAALRPLRPSRQPLHVNTMAASIGLLPGQKYAKIVWSWGSLNYL